MKKLGTIFILAFVLLSTPVMNAFAGWEDIGSDSYYRNADGELLTGWVLFTMGWFYFYEDGKMAHDTTIGEYQIGSNGVWKDPNTPPPLYSEMGVKWEICNADGQDAINKGKANGTVVYYGGYYWKAHTASPAETASSVGAPPYGGTWYRCGSIELSKLLKGLSDGTIVYYEGEYWTNVHITGEDVYVLEDLATVEYQKTYQTLTPELSLSLDRR